MSDSQTPFYSEKKFQKLMSHKRALSARMQPPHQDKFIWTSVRLKSKTWNFPSYFFFIFPVNNQTRTDELFCLNIRLLRPPQWENSSKSKSLILNTSFGKSPSSSLRLTKSRDPFLFEGERRSKFFSFWEFWFLIEKKPRFEPYKIIAINNF